MGVRQVVGNALSRARPGRRLDALGQSWPRLEGARRHQDRVLSRGLDRAIALHSPSATRDDKPIIPAAMTARALRMRGRPRIGLAYFREDLVEVIRDWIETRPMEEAQSYFLLVFGSGGEQPIADLP